MSGYVEDDEILGRAYDHRLVRRLWRFVSPYRGTAVLAIVLLLAEKLAFLGLPFFLGCVVDLLAGNLDLGRAPWVPEAWRPAAAALPLGRQLLVLVAAYGGLMLASFLATIAHTYLTGLMGAHVVRDMRRELFAHIQRLPMATFDRTPVGRWITRITNDVVAISELFTTGIIVAFGDLVLLLGIIVVLAVVHWKLALASLSVLPVLFFMTWVFRAKARSAFRQVRMFLARINAYLQESVSGAAVTMLFARQAENARRFKGLVEDHYGSCLSNLRIHAMYVSLITLVTGISLAAAVGYGGWLVATGALALGQLVAFLWYLGHFVQPVQDLADKYNVFQSAMASAERIFKILDTPKEEEPAGRGEGTGERGEEEKTTRGAEIDFRNVTFAYGKEPILKGISFRVAPGERVAVVGSTGSGKTTLVNLLCRFYDLQEGEIRVDGVDIGRMPRAYARSKVALVLQEPVIFSGDVYSNIRLGESAIPDDAVHAAAERVRAGDFLRDLPEGFRTVLPERGSTLSSGQRQLITYARALAFDRPVLILDEATAHIDPETEALIQEGLETLMAGRTTIIIAHRLATLREAHRILVMDRGRLVEEGTHRELLAKGGIYARMHAYQYA